ncbi:MAG TPA: type IV pilus secretin PilQ [Patescibacteria group bacterium]|nr:type IV pilus secretin PilQ [Patescibacteria group bacterium]
MRWGRMVGATLLTLCALGCAANPPVTEPAAPLPDNSGRAQSEAAGQADNGQAQLPGSNRIESITAQPGENGTVVTIRGDHPLSYTSYDPEATRLVLELPDVDASAVQPSIEVGTAQLGRIEVTQVPSQNGSNHARVELVGRMSADTHIEPNGADIVITLLGVTPGVTPGAPQAAPAISSASPAVPETAATTAAARQASRLNAVNITGSQEQPIVLLEGDGAMEYKSFELDNPPRLVVDVLGVHNGVKSKKIPVGASGVNQVRVSQFSGMPDQVTRVVFDLSRREAYKIETGSSNVAVSFTGPQVEDQTTAASNATLPGDTPSTATTGSTQPVQSNQEPVAVVRAPKPAPKAQDAEPASSRNLNDLGHDVVLFDRADARPMQSAGSRSGEAVNMNTLPQNAYESRTIAGGRKQYRGEKISVAFRDADLREVMFFFADVMKMNVVLDPDVAGKVDIKLNQVPWDQAFQVILKNQGLDAIEEENVVRIAKTSKLRQEAADLKALKQAQEQAVDPVTFTRTLSYAKVADAVNVLQQVKTERGKIVADVRTNTLIISDIPEKQSAYNGLLDALDTQTPQVIIEARIVEAIRNYERDLGINWKIASSRAPATGNPYPYRFPNRVDFAADLNTAPTGFPSAGTIGLMLGNIADTLTLDIALEAFEADGKVRILSSPKIATQNNQPATIEQGVQIPVVTTTATEIDVQYVPASLRLVVTPQITAEDTVIMKLKVENNQPSNTIRVSGTPGIVTESVDTQILVRTGTTAVIGGVYKLQESESETGLPGLRKIPFFGWLFKNKVNKKDSSELLVFITPKIVKNI